MPRLFSKQFTANSIPCEIAVEIDTDTGQHRILLYLDGAPQADFVSTAHDGNLEAVITTAERILRSKAEQARLGVLDSEPESVRTLKRLGYIEIAQ